jgi:hypothetical protein
MPSVLRLSEPICRVIDVTGDHRSPPDFDHFIQTRNHYKVFIHVLAAPLSEAVWFEAHIRVFTPHPIPDGSGFAYYEGPRWDCDPITNTIHFSRLTPEFETDFSSQDVWENFALDLVDTYLAVQEPQPELPYSGPRPTRYERGWVI